MNSRALVDQRAWCSGKYMGSSLREVCFQDGVFAWRNCRSKDNLPLSLHAYNGGSVAASTAPFPLHFLPIPLKFRSRPPRNQTSDRDKNSAANRNDVAMY